MNLENFGWLLIGFGGGLAVGACVFDYVTDSQTQNACESQGESFSSPIINDHDIPVDKNENDPIKPSDSLGDFRNGYKTTTVDYTKFAEGEVPLDEDDPDYKDDIPEEENDEEKSVKNKMPDPLPQTNVAAYKDGGAPRVISKEELEEPWPGNTVPLLYFQKDGVLMEEISGQTVDDIRMTVGNGLSYFGATDPERPNFVAVRNEAFNVQYEIEKCEGSYVENILGVPLE